MKERELNPIVMHIFVDSEKCIIIRTIMKETEPNLTVLHTFIDSENCINILYFNRY